jgi:dimethylglycine dehydrogenase
MGYVNPDHAAVGTRLEVRMQDRLWPAEIVEDSPYDRQNTQIRADGVPAPSPADLPAE